MNIIKHATQPAQPTTALRIEERRTIDGQTATTAVLTTWDRQPLTRQTGWDVLVMSRRQHPERYGPHGEYRLVLVEGGGR